MISLSWSRLSDYDQCPRKFYLKYIEKAFPKEDTSIHLVRGKELHAQLEQYIIAKNGGPMPIGFSPEVQRTLPLIDNIFDTFDEVHPEAQVACDKQWQPEEWFGKNVMYRAIWDTIGIKRDQITIYDWKSGKFYEYGKDYGQLHLSAIMAMKRFNVPRVDTAYVFIEHKKYTKISIDETEGKKIEVHFENKFDQVQNETTWKPIANEFCKWCPAVKSQCQFSRKF